MRFIHTGDWHLGKLLRDRSLTDDQQFALAGLVDLAESVQADAVVVSGDVFDRAVPPVPAVGLLDEVLGELTLGLGVPVIMIAGNHDSPVRLQYLGGLVGQVGLHVVGEVGPEPRGVAVTGRDGVDVVFWPLAYTDPETARGALGRADIHTHAAVLAAHLESVRERTDDSARHVVIAHAFVSGALSCESERPLTVGGTGEVPADLFAGFDYVALGHLHRPQRAGEHLQYAGSLLKYSFDEADHHKSVSVVELGTGGPPVIEQRQLPVRRDLRRVSGTFAEVMEHPDDSLREAYLEVVLTGGEAILDPMERLRAVYPNILSLRREGLSALDAEASDRPAVRGRSTRDLFAEFFAEVTTEPLSQVQQDEVDGALTSAERQQREVAT
jgi:DNA repair protein SbcD/Mre11